MTGTTSPIDPAPRRSSPAIWAIVIVAIIVAIVVLLLPRSGPTDPGGASPSHSSSASDPPSSSPTPGPTAAPTTTPTQIPTPAPTPVPEAILVGAGDIADCKLEGDGRTAALLDEIDGTVFTAGDNAYGSGTAKQFATCYTETWGRHLERTRPAPGNHDWRTAGLAGYFGYYGEAAQGPGGTSWYSYDLGAWHIIMLDSECGELGGCTLDTAQGRWLEADLAASSTSCTAAIWHKPRFSSGEHGNHSSIRPFWTALHQAGADVVVSGHDHDYERFAPQDPAGRADPLAGIRQFVAGTGGARLRPFKESRANSEVRILEHGVLKLTLRDGSYDWEFVSVTGEIADRGTDACH